jgi:cysteine desulfurase
VLASERIYLDWNATAPPLPSVLAAMQRAAETAWGNPSSVHAHGRAARAFVEDARAAVARLADCDPRDVVLTSGGTEANNLALRSYFARGRGTLVTSRLEHPSVTRVAEALAREGGARVRWLAVLPSGQIDLADLDRALDESRAEEAGPVVVAMQAVNHETGVAQPLEAVTARVSSARAQLHVDAVQAFGRWESTGAGADTRAMAAHKMRGPKGIGALIVRQGVSLEPLLRGGAQERGLRPGTVDPIGAAGFAVAADHARAQAYARLAPLRDELERDLTALQETYVVNGQGARAPHVTNIAFGGWSGAELVAALDLEGVSVSSGSACSAGTLEPSPVIVAMSDEGRAAASVRISMGEETTKEQLAQVVAIFERVLQRGR